jgi:tetratricopeptide (TPR) repeat protein
MRGGQRYDAAQVLGGRADAHMNLGAVLTKLGRHAEAADALRRCVALSQTSPDTLGRVHRDCSRMLGAALANLGDYRGAKELLEPLASSLVPDDVKPLPRASFRFALARALWHAGGLEDRPRAEALIADAEVDIQAAIADGEKLPYLRRLPARARELRAEIEDWRRKR